MPLPHPLLPPSLEMSSHRSKHYPRGIRRLLAAVSSSWDTPSFQALSALYARPRFHVKQLVPDITRPPSISGTRPLFRFATASTDRRPLIGCSCGAAQCLSRQSDRIDQADSEGPSCVVRRTGLRSISCSSSSSTSHFVPSVSRETSAALVLCQTLTEHTNGMRDAIVRGPRQAIQTSAAIDEQFSTTESNDLSAAVSLQSGSHLLYLRGSSILLPPPGEDASVSTVT